MAFIKLRLM